MRQVPFGTLIPRLEFRKHPGKPWQQWLSTTLYADAYKASNQLHPFDMDNPAHRSSQRISSPGNGSLFMIHRFTTKNCHRKAEGFLPALPI